MPKLKAPSVPRSKNLANPLVAMAFIAGIGLIITGLFKFHQWKQNPQNASGDNP
jgi:hypothetical protein